ncbi:MAG: hypothetical protein ACK4OM_07735 [Alphaproteobacteria bacterium]
MNILNYAINEELQRRVQTIKEINILSKIIQNKVGFYENEQLLKDKAIAAIEHDIYLSNKLKKYLEHHELADELYVYTTNKLIEAFSGAKKLIENDFYELISDSFSDKYLLDPYEIIRFETNSNNVMGTSMPNFIQLALFTILSVAGNYNNFSEVTELTENNIYNFNYSPNIQTSAIFKQINDFELEQGIKNWIYYLDDGNHIPSLAVFNLGYFYGGSRDNSQYKNKYFRMEDCSSSIAKWLNSDVEFSTIHMEEVFDGDIENSFAQEASKFLMPIKDRLPIAGDIFTYRKYNIEKDPGKLDRANSMSGHTGIVANYYEKENKHYFEHLSYNRDIPKIEGLGYKIECIENFPEKKYMFFEPIELIGETDFTV